jgi:hypothetical protein
VARHDFEQSLQQNISDKLSRMPSTRLSRSTHRL